MTTLASPTQGGSRHAVWRVDMEPGASGPAHVFDADQIWTVLEGGARIDLDGEAVTIASGDTVIMPADAQRQVFADAEDGLTAIACAPADARVYRSAPSAGVPAAATLDGDKILPNWIAQVASASSPSRPARVDRRPISRGRRSSAGPPR